MDVAYSLYTIEMAIYISVCRVFKSDHKATSLHLLPQSLHCVTNIARGAARTDLRDNSRVYM